MELTGKLVAIGDIIEGQGARGPWQKQIFVIETMDQYPKKIACLAWNDKVNDIAVLNLGDVLTVGIDLESREFNGKWYTDVKAWSIKGASLSASQAAQTPNPPQAPLPPMPGTQQQDIYFNTEDSDDLPF